jgi:hypothetical protein
VKKASLSKKESDFELEIGFSQSVIITDIVLGCLFLIGGIALGIWSNSWVIIILPILGLLSLWQAIKRSRAQGPQLKIGGQGIWTLKTGFLPWNKAKAIIKTEVSFRSATTYLIILARDNSEKEVARMMLRMLDIEERNLQAYLNRYLPRPK